jgi:hypothetical protein
MSKLHISLYISLFASITYAKELPLPKSLQGKAVHFMKSYQLPHFSCGYDVLFNGCSIEHSLGIYNSCSNFNNFKTLCLNYLATKNVKTDQAASNELMAELASRCGLRQFHFFVWDATKKVYPFVSHVSIKYSLGSTETQIRELMKKASLKSEQAVVDNLKTHLKHSMGNLSVMHFVCCITDLAQSHYILVTLVQSAYGYRGLYVFDNMNTTIHEKSQTKQYIHYFCTTFSISNLDKTQVYQFPERWPSII